MSVDPTFAQPGMDVFGSDGDHVGRVREIHPDGVLLDGTGWRVLFLPSCLLVQIDARHRRIDLSIPTRNALELCCSAG